MLVSRASVQEGSKSTLADVNEKRDCRIYAVFAQILIGIASQIYADENFGLAPVQTVYALDSTTIDLSLPGVRQDAFGRFTHRSIEIIEFF